MANRIPERVWRETCDSIHTIRMLFGIGAMSFVLMLIWAPFVSRDSATFVIVVLNLVAAGAILLFTIPLIIICQRRKQHGQSSE